ncbi:MAG TPA: hypothetical protein VFJ77_02075 [Gaiellaceae bacterium]|nr:hypothetical protein [Gaiellaceae bacterium]
MLAAAAAALVSATATRADGDGTALFGLYPGENNALLVLPGPTFAYNDNYLPAMVAWQGRDNDVINVYNQINGAGGVQTTTGTYLPTIWNTYHSVPMISLNTNNWTNAQVASGAADADIDAYADALRDNFVEGDGAPEGGRRVYIRLDWEMNGNFSPWEPPNSKNSHDCASLLSAEQDYVAMWRHFHDEFMTEGGFDSTQVQWVYSIYYFDVLSPAETGCANGASDVVANTYPGNDYVDWVGVDGYAYNEGPSGTPFDTPSSIFDPAFARLNAVTGGTKPLSTNEVGVSTHGTGSPDQTVANKAQWISDYFADIESQGVKMALWFSIDLGATSFHNLAVFCKKNAGLADLYCNGDNTYASGGKTYNVYDEYKTGVDSSYFISPDTSNPRLLTDAQFQGA